MLSLDMSCEVCSRRGGGGGSWVNKQYSTVQYSTGGGGAGLTSKGTRVAGGEFSLAARPDFYSDLMKFCSFIHLYCKYITGRFCLM